jgi:hypothetical protein
MFNLINEFLWRFIKRLFISIKDDCIDRIRGFVAVVLFIAISSFIFDHVNSNKVAITIIIFIVVSVFALVYYFYKGKS